MDPQHLAPICYLGYKHILPKLLVSQHAHPSQTHKSRGELHDLATAARWSSSALASSISARLSVTRASIFVSPALRVFLETSEIYGVYDVDTLKGFQPRFMSIIYTLTCFMTIMMDEMYSYDGCF